MSCSKRCRTGGDDGEHPKCRKRDEGNSDERTDDLEDQSGFAKAFLAPHEDEDGQAHTAEERGDNSQEDPG